MKLPPDDLLPVYRRLFDTWGPQAWWPAETRLEMILGAILTQNTAWRNVEMALDRLREAGALDVDRLHQADPEELEDWIRPAGTFRVKARRVRAFVDLLMDEYAGELDSLLSEPTDRLRVRLLSVSGIGPETADCILLYAAGRPQVVVDAYLRRLLRRHGWLPASDSYDKVAAWLGERLPSDPTLLNEFHALIVRLGKEHCRAKPACGDCPLRDLLPRGGAMMT